MLFFSATMISASSYIPFDFTVLSDEECFNEDDQLYSVSNAPELPELSPSSPQAASAPVMRQRAVGLPCLQGQAYSTHSPMGGK